MRLRTVFRGFEGVFLKRDLKMEAENEQEGVVVEMDEMQSTGSSTATQAEENEERHEKKSRWRCCGKIF